MKKKVKNSSSSKTKTKKKPEAKKKAVKHKTTRKTVTHKKATHKKAKKAPVTKRKTSTRKSPTRAHTKKHSHHKKTTKRKTTQRRSSTTKAMNFPKRKSGIKVKRKLERLPTTIPNFDKLIQGGYESESTNLIVGSSGSGKTVFATHYLMGGMKKGEHCLYVTFEEKKEQFYQNMLKFGWDLEKYEKKGLFTFLEYTPIKVKTMLEEGGGAIESIILKHKTKRMVIDSITSFALLFDNDLEKRDATLTLFNMIKRWHCTSLITFEGEKKYNDKTERAIEFESDSITTFYFLRNHAERIRYLEVIKMRGTNHSNKIFSFDIGRTGVKVNSKSVSKLPREVLLT